VPQLRGGACLLPAVRGVAGGEAKAGGGGSASEGWEGLMNKAQTRRLTDWLQRWQKLLRLTGWLPANLHVYERTELPPEIADWKIKAGQLNCNFRDLTVAIHIAELDGHASRETVVHELVHLSLAEMCTAMERAKEKLAPGEWALIAEEYGDAEERAVNRLTAALLELDGFKDEREDPTDGPS